MNLQIILNFLKETKRLIEEDPDSEKTRELVLLATQLLPGSTEYIPDEKLVKLKSIYEYARNCEFTHCEIYACLGENPYEYVSTKTTFDDRLFRELSCKVPSKIDCDRCRQYPRDMYYVLYCKDCRKNNPSHDTISLVEYWTRLGKLVNILLVLHKETFSDPNENV